MPRQHAPTRIAEGIVRDGNRLVAEVRNGSSRDGTQTRLRKQFPLGTAIAEMRAWQHGARHELATAAPSAVARGSLAADIAEFVAAQPEGRYRVDTEDLLTHWAQSTVGGMDRRTITRLDLIGVISSWTTAGAAENTCNRRLSRLRKLYRAFDGFEPNPTDAIIYLREPRPEPRDIPARIVKLILDSLPDQGRAAKKGEPRPDVSETKIRLRVMAWTGQPQATILRIKSRDLDLAHARLFLRWRRKGKGSEGTWITLLAPAVDALRDFVAAGLIGRRWSNSSAGKTWRVGITRATAAAARVAAETGDTSWTDELANLPPDCHPYDMRHAFASEIYRRTGDIGAVSELLQHSSFETTKRYTRGAVSARVAAAIATAGATYATLETIPAPVKKPALKLMQPSGTGAA